MHGSFPFAWGDLGYHPDHQACGAFAFEAINGPACWTKNALPQLQALPVLKGVAFYEFALTSATSDVFLALSEATLSAKINAIRQHKSQFAPDSKIDVNVRWVAEQVATAVNDRNGTVGGATHRGEKQQPVSLAEAFRVFA